MGAGWASQEGMNADGRQIAEIEGLEKTLAELTNGKEKTSSP